jgi:hypothetical protein
MFSVLTTFSLVDFLVPLTGRSGSQVPPDLVVGVIVAMLVCLTCARVVPFVVHTASKWLRMAMAGGLVVLYVTGLVFAISGAAFPYSGGDYPAPKRLFLQHTDRVFFNKDGTTRLADTRVVIVPTDYTDIYPILNAVPDLSRAVKEWECEGLFCGIPLYLPLMKYIKRFWYVSAPPLNNVPQASLKLMSAVDTTPGRRNFTFFLSTPPRASIFISPHQHQILISWSLEEFIPPSLPCNHMEPQGAQCHFIFYCRGAGEQGEAFWLELEGPPKSSEVVEIAVATQLLDPPFSITPTLTSLLSSLPDWVTPVGWTATYTSWTF